MQHNGNGSESVGVGPGAYAGWVVIGAVIAFGVAALLSIDLVLIVIGVVLAIVASRSPRMRGGSAWMALVGASAAPWFIAWLNRDGPVGGALLAFRSRSVKRAETPAT